MPIGLIRATPRKSWLLARRERDSSTIAHGRVHTRALGHCRIRQLRAAPSPRLTPSGLWARPAADARSPQSWAQARNRREPGLPRDDGWRTVPSGARDIAVPAFDSQHNVVAARQCQNDYRVYPAPTCQETSITGRCRAHDARRDPPSPCHRQGPWRGETSEASSATASSATQATSRSKWHCLRIERESSSLSFDE